jgi:hypothetical protein
LIEEHLLPYSKLLLFQDPADEAFQATASDHDPLGVTRTARGEDDVPEIILLKAHRL